MKTRKTYTVEAEIDEEGTEITLDFLDLETNEWKTSMTFGFGIGHSRGIVQRFWGEFNA